ncbi:unnamed protein product, partial [Iphiclides podalirius]
MSTLVGCVCPHYPLRATQCAQALEAIQTRRMILVSPARNLRSQWGLACNVGNRHFEGDHASVFKELGCNFYFVLKTYFLTRPVSRVL